VLDFPQYQLHARFLAEPSLMLHDEHNNIVKMGCPSPTKTCDVFDFAQAKARALFIEECVNATRSGVVDGCFADRAVDGTPTDSARASLHVPHCWRVCARASTGWQAPTRFGLIATSTSPPPPGGDDTVPCAGSNCRYQLNLTAAQSKAYADGHVKVLTDLQAALGEGPLIANHACAAACPPARLCAQLWTMYVICCPLRVALQLWTST
jgi:hypothetical protein